MNAEMRTKATQFHFWEYINGLFVAVHQPVQCSGLLLSLASLIRSLACLRFWSLISLICMISPNLVHTFRLSVYELVYSCNLLD
jgi:hypothetical protein